MRERTEKMIFGNIFLLANQLQTTIDRDFKPHDLTAKQWFLMASIGEFGPLTPTISQVSELMGSSHQNVKQLALKLEKNGFVKIIRDETDRRRLRLELTEKCHEFWESRLADDQLFFKKLFGTFTDQQIKTMSKMLTEMNNILKSD